jgi:hypothetical protein
MTSHYPEASKPSKVVPIIPHHTSIKLPHNSTHTTQSPPPDQSYCRSCTPLKLQNYKHHPHPFPHTIATMLRQSITKAIRPAQFRAFSISARTMAGGDTGATRSGGVAQGYILLPTIHPKYLCCIRQLELRIWTGVLIVLVINRSMLTLMKLQRRIQQT